MTKIFPHFLSSEMENTAMNKALFHVIPVPFEYSVSYGKGTASGPLAILEASEQLELFDSYTQTYPAREGIHTQKAVIEDSPEGMLEKLQVATKIALENNALPVILGGEHSITTGALRALKEEFGIFGIVHIDAHADLRDSYEGSQYSHASVMHRALDLELPLVQFGTRAYSEEEFEVRQEHKDLIKAYDAHLFSDWGKFLPKGASEDSLLPEDFPKKIFISFDVDGLDPSIIAHTGTPVVGGLGWYQSLELLAFCLKDRELVGFDVVELAPTENSQVSDYACADLVYKIMGLHINNTKK